MLTRSSIKSLIISNIFLLGFLQSCGGADEVKMNEIRTTLEDKLDEKSQYSAHNFQSSDDHTTVVADRKEGNAENDDQAVLTGQFEIHREEVELLDLTINGDIFLSSQETAIQSAGDVFLIDAKKSLPGSFMIELPVDSGDSGFNLTSSKDLDKCQLMVMYHLKFPGQNDSTFGFILLEKKSINGNGKVLVEYFGNGIYQPAANCSGTLIDSGKSVSLNKSPKDIVKEVKDLKEQVADQEDHGQDFNLYKFVDEFTTSDVRRGDTQILEAVVKAVAKVKDAIEKLEIRLDEMNADLKKFELKLADLEAGYSEELKKTDDEEHKESIHKLFSAKISNTKLTIRNIRQDIEKIKEKIENVKKLEESNKTVGEKALNGDDKEIEEVLEEKIKEIETRSQSVDTKKTDDDKESEEIKKAREEALKAAEKAREEAAKAEEKAKEEAEKAREEAAKAREKAKEGDEDEDDDD